MLLIINFTNHLILQLYKIIDICKIFLLLAINTIIFIYYFYNNKISRLFYLYDICKRGYFTIAYMNTSTVNEYINIIIIYSSRYFVRDIYTGYLVIDSRVQLWNSDCARRDILN